MRKILLALLLLATITLHAQPKLKGGLESFIINNKIYPPYSLQNCIDGTVTIGFKLNQKGEVFYSEIRKGIGTDLDDEALRLIRLSSGRWIMPADHDTTVVMIAPINFKLSGYDCGNKSRQEILQAIQNYKTNEGLTDVVINFYKNKTSSDVKEEDEQRILAIKKSLGYNDGYFQKVIADGKKKLKQKDKQGACEDFLFVKHMGSPLADELLLKYCN